jgi:tRNA(Ile)-lysidine synthase
VRRSIQSQIINEVKTAVEQHHMLDSVSKAIIAFSGGPDSVCLLNALYRLYHNRLQFFIIYVNHGLRSQKALEKEENLAKYYAVKYSMQCRIIRIKIKKTKVGIEAAAREARYNALQQYMRDSHATRIALGHNSDDVVETFIMNMMRGSGATGLSALGAVRIPYIRPLLYVRKADILRCVRAQKLPYCEDETNQKLEYRRNLFRHKIIPELLKINPALHEAIHRTINLIHKDNECLDELADTAYQATVRKDRDRLVLDMKKLMQYNPAVVGRVIRRMIKDVVGGLEGFESKHIRAIESLNDKPSGTIIDLPKQIFAQRHADNVVISRKRKSRQQRIPVDPNGDRIMLDDSVVRVRTESNFDLKRRRKGCEVFDLEKLSLPLEFRTRHQGDVLVTRIGKKMLKKIYSEQRIPYYKRTELLMLCDRNGILMIPGIVRAYRGYIDAKTRRFLVVDYENPCRRA